MPGESDNLAEVERQLHERLLAGDPLVTVDLFERYSVMIYRGLAARYRTTDLDLVEEAVSRSLFDYFVHPERYDASKRSLRGYLRMAAERDLQTLYEKQRRRRVLTRDASEIELDARAHQNWQVSGDLAEAIVEEEGASDLAERLMAVATTDEERIVQSLRLDGEFTTEAFAEALGWTDLSPEEQRARLYRIKDRLDKRLRRRRAKG